MAAALLAVAAPLGAQGTSNGLKNFSLEDLMRIEVTSVAKKEQKLSEAASAIFVITGEDLVRSGATSIAEALRMVPGLAVARIDGSKWAVSARGFNGRFANKMLVLIDGRSVYTPLFSGVYWDVQDLLLADVDRIEVIRGPGATLWGANAVNGVINVITRAARETQGMAVSLVTGDEDRAVVEARYGDALGTHSDYRLFVKHVDRTAAEGQADDWDLTRAGGRLDWRISPDEMLTLEGVGYAGSAGQAYGPVSLLPFYTEPLVTRATVEGGYLRGRWTRALSARSDLMVQSYFDYTDRQESALVGESRRTAEIELQHRTSAGTRQDIVWGAGYRSTADTISAGSMIRLTPAARADRLINVFVQDEITVQPDRLRLTLGAKAEHNSYTGWEWQPNVRASLVLDARQTVWAASSRAVRTPSRAETDVSITVSPVHIPGGPTVLTTLYGSADFVSETMRAHEAGYRVSPHARFSLDVAGFYNVYDHLRTFEPGTPVPDLTPDGPVLRAPMFFGNQMAGETRGVEISAHWTPGARWRVDGAYSFLDLRLRHKPGSADQFSIVIEDESPSHQARLHAGATLLDYLDLDASVAYTGRLHRHAIPAYLRVDARLGWHVSPGVVAAVGVRNLTDSRHVEFASTLGEVITDARRSAFVQLSWEF
jgi:iron complex outermembrane receptor protein